jgi:hypothetical protein
LQAAISKLVFGTLMDGIYFMAQQSVEMLRHRALDSSINTLPAFYTQKIEA